MSCNCLVLRLCIIYKFIRVYIYVIGVLCNNNNIVLLSGFIIIV